MGVVAWPTYLWTFAGEDDGGDVISFSIPRQGPFQVFVLEKTTRISDLPPQIIVAPIMYRDLI